ncbi:MAG: dicarboxylate/amino acid:cation symporter [Candidatus Abyssobacteria bacterium SURF_5]|uniref:Dicarboxylate/amino acid:cation symporter n=1 Tax=Abyssobacteria bacterium (strain SURF_5) TaxID=2093360 RepID=A0A3A4NHC0_ABYX5|nr:MAG: dicarboxylate/amino acid:cation symporter [Candidatus Abyssubacteria bacterium SURF_5]
MQEPRTGTSGKILAGIVIGMIAGGICGWFFGERMETVKWIGDLFLNALKMIIVPLIVASMITGIGNLGDIRKLGRTGLYTFAYFLSTTGISVLIGLMLVNIFTPGAGMNFGETYAPTAVLEKDLSLTAVLIGMIPENIFEAAAKNDVLPLIVFSLFFGAVTSTLGERGKPVLVFFGAVNEAIMKMVHIILYFAPIGVFALIAYRLGKAGGGDLFWAALAKLFSYAGTVILGLLMHALLVLPFLLWLLGRRNPAQYSLNMMPALTTAFSTASSSATLPLTMECVEHRNDVSNESASFVLPMGATINMDGTALYEAVAAMFIAQAYGVTLGLPEQAIIFLTATLAAIGAAGIPEAGLVTMVIVLKSVGLPLEGIGLLLSIDWFLDRCRTTVNVWGDAVGAAVVDRIAGIGKKEQIVRPAASLPVQEHTIKR